MAEATSVRPTATYKSPSAEQKITGAPVTKPTPESPKERSLHLQRLKKSCQGMQKEINAMLTQKMEEDRANSTAQAVDEKKEEENYGEEVDDE